MRVLREEKGWDNAFAPPKFVDAPMSLIIETGPRLQAVNMMKGNKDGLALKVVLKRTIENSHRRHGRHRDGDVKKLSSVIALDGKFGL